MGLFDKIKDILFVEEEEIPVITKKEPEIKEKPKEEKKEEPILSRSRSLKRDIEPQHEPEPPRPEPKPIEKEHSPFLAFDEEEFERMNYRASKPKKPPVSEPYIKTTTTTIKKVEHKDYSRYEMKKVEEKKPFRPSPVISPVYGILDKNYKKEDVVTRVKEDTDLVRDVDSIRQKAYCIVTEMPEIEEDLLPKKVNNEKSIDDLILDNFSDSEEPPVVKVEKVEEPITNIVEEEEPVVDDYQVVDEHTSALEILDEIEKELNKDKEKDTLEGDLFNLIDSMYEERKEE